MATKDSKNPGSKSDERNVVESSQVDIQDLEDQVILLWQKNRNLILGSVAALFIAFLGYNGYLYMQRQAEQKLQAGYLAATSDEARLAWAERESGSALAGFAFKELADKAYAAGDFAKAEGLYRKAAESAESVVKNAAEMGLAAALIELSKTDEAKKLLAKVADDSNNPARPEAQFRLAQIAHKEGNDEVARNYLESIGVDGGIWQQRAMSLLAEIGSGEA